MASWREAPPSWSVLALSTALAATLGGAVGGLVTREGVHNQTLPRPESVLLGSSAQTPPVVERRTGSIANVAARILPSVVSIQVRAPGESDTGSGIVLSRTGYLLTNNHVVAGVISGGKLSVVLPDKRTVGATIVGRDVVSDLAVLRIIGVHGLSPATLGTSDQLQVGDPVVAVGSPLGLAGTVTSGIVSALDRPVEAGGGSTSTDDVIDAIQTDAAINPGNSGGPLVNAAGEVVGVNSAIATLSGPDAFGGGQSGSIGLGFAIPIDQAKRIAQQLIKNGYSTHAIIGVALDGAYTGQGARIKRSGKDAITSGGPADRAGLKAGDIIVSINGIRVVTADELIIEIRKRVPGEQVTLRYLRDGTSHSAVVTLGSARSD